MRIQRSLIVALLTLTVPLLTWAYEGFGACAQGGDSYSIVYVTNLQDAGSGSLRAALAGGYRRVHFRVAGTITLTDEIQIRSPYITVDGTTAPSPGITLKNYGLIVRGGGHNTILKNIRIRNAAQDGIWITDGARCVVIDHVSIHNSGDGNCDITRTNTRDITVQWSLFAEPAGEEKNALLAFGSSRMTMHHNLWIASRQRNPQASYSDSGALDPNTTLDFRNNFVYDWRGGLGTRIRRGSRANVVNNYYSGSDKDDALIICKPGSTVSECDDGSLNNVKAYVRGNINVGGPNINGRGTELSPLPAPFVTTEEAFAAACKVWESAGAFPRDGVDSAYLLRIRLSGCP